MNPLAIAGLGLGGLASLFGGHKAPKPGELDKLFGPEGLAKRKNALFSLLASSPAFRQALGQTNLAGQQLGQNINANLARSGLLQGSGIGAIGGAMGNAAGGFAQGNLIAGLDQAALEKAMHLNDLLAGLYGQFQGQQLGQSSPLQQGGSALLGALGPIFAKGKTPKTTTKPAGGASTAPEFGPDLFGDIFGWPAGVGAKP